MQAAAAAPPSATAPLPPPRHRVYMPVDPRCEWARTDDADTLVVDVSGFRKEELKVLYNTSRKLKVTGERHVDGGQWARFLKTLPVPRSCDTGAIRAIMDKEDALLYVILPKVSSSSSSSKKDKKKEEQNMRSQPQGEQQGGAAMADGSSSSSTGSLWSAQEDVGKGNAEKGEREEEIVTQDVPITHDDDANGDKRDDDEMGNKSKRWCKKIRPLHALGCVLILALVGLGVCVLCVMLL